MTEKGKQNLGSGVQLEKVFFFSGVFVAFLQIIKKN